MKKMQGFTLVEVSIVLVIIGLMLGGMLKGQELIDNAKVKNLAADFRNVPVLIYAYQDKYRAIPGDDSSVDLRITGATKASTPATCGGGSASCLGNGQLDGAWNSSTASDETFLFWQHVRLAGLTAGSTDTSASAYLPRHAGGGLFGIEGGNGHLIKDATANATTYLAGSYIACAQGVAGKLAKQLDITLDDGNPQSGNVRVISDNHTRGNAALAVSSIDDATAYTVCQGF